MFNTDAEQSLRAFNKFTRPAVLALKVKYILSTERQDSELATLLDMKAGVDGVLLTDDGQIFNYASRIQFGVNYGAFSIRRSRPTGTPTEYKKLLRAQKTGAAMPFVHIQTFVAEDEQSAVVAIALTSNLLQYVDKHQDKWRKTSDGETFYYIPFEDVAAQIYYVNSNGNVQKKNAA